MKYFLRYFIAATLIILLGISNLISAPLQIDSIKVESARCFNEHSGKITIYVSGGTNGYKYIWFNINTNAVSGNYVGNETSHTFTGLQAASGYILYVLDNKGNSPYTQVQTMTDLFEPENLTASVSIVPSAVCAGYDVNLNGNPAGGNGGNVHLWSGAATAFFTIGTVTDNPVTFNCPTPGDYALSYTVTDYKGCTATDDVTVTVNGTPDISISSNAPGNEACQGSNVTFTALPNDATLEYEFFVNGGPVIRSTSNTYSTSALNNGDIVSVNAYTTAGCSNISTAALTMTINPLPAVGLTVNDNSICPGTSVTFTATPAGLNSYNFIRNGSSVRNNSIRIYSTTSVADGDVFSVTGTNNKGCVNTSVPVNMTVFTVTPASAINNSPVCVGSSINLSGNPIGSSYAWTGPNGFTSNLQNPVLANSNATTAMSGTYSYTVTDGNGCNLSANTTITVNANPLATAVNSGPYCADADNVVLTGGPNGMSSYSWTGPNGFTSGSQSPTVGLASALTAGSYTLVVADGNGCTANASTTVVVNSIPSAPTVTSNPPRCGTGTVTLTATPGAGGDVVEWSTVANFATSSIGNSFTTPSIIAPGSLTVYLRTRNSGTGCVSTPATTATAVANPNPTASANGNSPICEGMTLNLTGIGTGNGLSYTWAGPDGYTSGQQNPTRNNVTIAVSGDYILTVTDVNSCTATSVKNISVIAAPADPTGMHDTTICGNGLVGFSATAAIAADSIQWSLNGGATIFRTDISPATLNRNLVAPVTENISARVKSVLTGCTSNWVTNTATAYIGPVANAGAVSTNVCEGDNIVLTGSPDAMNEYDWTGPAGFTSTIQNPVRNAAVEDHEGYYVLTVTDPMGCTDIDSVQVIVNPTPSTTFTPAASPSTICFLDNANVNISATVSGNSYQIMNNFNVAVGAATNGTGSAISMSIANADILVTGTNTYYIQVTSSAGCIANSANFTVNKKQAVTQTVTPVNLVCFGGNGSIRSVGAGGATPYVVSLNNGTDNYPYANNMNIPVAAGTYQVRVRDASPQQCTSTPQSITITQPDAITFTIDSSSASCLNNDGYIKFLFTSGGSGSNYEYSIYGDNGFSTLTEYQGLASDDYYLIVKDGIGCLSDSMLVHLDDGGQIIVGRIVPPTPACYGSTITITLTAFSTKGGFGNFNYAVSTDPNTPGVYQASPDFDVLVGSTYFGFAKDLSTGCVGSASLGTFNSKPKIVASTVNITNASCFNSPDGAIIVGSVTGGSGGPYTFDVDAPFNLTPNKTFTGLLPGTHTIRMADNGGVCYQDSVVTITSPPAINRDNLIITELTCPNDNTGRIEVSASGGSGGLTYAIDGATYTAQQVYTSLNGGIYTVSIKDAINCKLDTTFTLFEPLPLAIASENAVNISCNNVTDGTITIVASGGVTPYKYTLMPAGILTNATGQFTGLDIGTYTVQIEESNNCSVVNSSNFTITRPDAITITSAVKVADVSCGSGSDGQITVTATGGTNPLNYILSGPVTLSNATGVFTNVPAGTYTISVTDANNCGPVFHGINITVSQPTPIYWASLVPVSPTCSGFTDGAVSAVATGGNLAFTYTLNGGNAQANANYSGLSAGIPYTLRATDQDGCFNDTTFTIAAPPAVTLSINPANAAICVNASQVYSATTNAPLPITYTWTANFGNINGAGSPTPSYTHSIAGNYTISLSITDGLGCTSNASTGVSVLAGPAISSQPANVEVCQGLPASFSVTATGADSYQWRKNGNPIPGETASTLNIASVTAAETGNYDVVVTGCGIDLTSNVAMLSLSPAPVITTQPANVTACSGNNVTFNVVASGTGLGYQWYRNGVSIPAATGASYTLNNVSAANQANYHVVVSGCGSSTTSNTASLTVNGTPQITTHPQNVIVCTGGTATFNVSATGAGLSYQWQKDNADIPLAVGSSFSLNNVQAADVANYRVIVTGCGGATVASNQASLSLDAATAITTQPTGTTLCAGENFSLTVAATGGNLSYQWQLNGSDILGATEATYSVASAIVANGGNYTVIVTGCNGTDTSNAALVTVKASGITAITPIVTNVSCNGLSDGSIQVEVTNGTNPIRYSLDGGPLQAPKNFSGLSAKGYNISVTDASLCPVNTSASVGQPAPLTIGSVSTTAHTSTSLGTAAINMASVGNGGLQYWYDINAQQVSNLLTDIPAGTYTAYVSDLKGCTDSRAFTIEDSSSILMTLTADSVSCYGDSDGAIHIAISGNSGPATITIDPGNDSINLAAGTYAVTATDTAGNRVTKTIVVPQPAPVSATITVVNYDGSAGTGSITIIGIGGTAPYKYDFLSVGNFINNNIYTDLPAATYTMSIKDSKSCPVKDTSVIVLDDSKLYFEKEYTDVACFGSNSGTVTVNIITGKAPYRFNLYGSNGGVNRTSGAIPINSRTYTFNNLPAGDYQARVRTALAPSLGNDSTSPTFKISELASTPLVINSAIATDQTTIVPNGTITVSVSGGVGSMSSYLFSLDNGITFIKNQGKFTSLVGDSTYKLAVRDDVGCIVYRDVYVGSNLPLVVNVSQNNETCAGANDGSITYNIVSGNKPFTYSFNGAPFVSGNVSETFTGLAPGNYTLSVFDKFDTKNFNITINAASAVVIDSISVTPSDVNTGTMTVHVSGGSGIYTFSYISAGGTSFNNGNNNVFTDLPSDTFYLRVDDVCSFAVDTAFVPGDSVLKANVGIEHIKCIQPFLLAYINIVPQNAIGSVTYTAIHEDTGFDYTQFDDGRVEVNDSGRYYLEVRDAVGKVFRDTVVVSSITTKINIVFDPIPSMCSETDVRTINATVTGGFGSYTYRWYNEANKNVIIANTEDLINVSKGTYRLVVIDGYNCAVEKKDSIKVRRPQILSAIVTPSICNVGLTTGSIEVTAVGDAPLKYTWDKSPLDTNKLTGIGAGQYTLILSDKSGCSDTAVYDVASTDSLLVRWKYNNISCVDTSNIGFEVIKGAPSFEFIVSDLGLLNDTIDTIAYSYSRPIAPGTYFTKVTGQNGCYADTLITITGMPVPVPIVIDSVTTTMASGGATGTALVHARGGNGILYYAIADASGIYGTFGPDSTFINLAGGAYTVAITDDNKCDTTYGNFVIEQDSVLLAYVSTVDDQCLGIEVTIHTLNAFGAVTYRMTMPDATQKQGTDSVFKAPVSGNYTFEAEDSEGKKYKLDTTITVTQPGLNITAITTNAKCSEITGSINVTVTGGTLPYEYKWTNLTDNTSAGNTEDLLAAIAGKRYQFVVTDGFSCSDTAEYTVLKDTLNVTSYSMQNPLCKPSINDSLKGGYIKIEVDGSAPYSFSYSANGGDTTHLVNINTNKFELDQLSEGKYSIKITDVNNCYTEVKDTLDYAFTLGFTAILADSASCVQNADGSVSLTSLNGTNPYKLSTTTSGNVKLFTDFNFLYAGSDTLIGKVFKADKATLIEITDSMGCYADTVISIPAKDSLQLEIVTHTDASCFNLGKISARAINGAAPYNFIWRGDTLPAGGNSFNKDTSAGSFSLAVYNTNCRFDTTLIIEMNDSFDIDLGITHASCFNYGSITAGIINGLGNFDFILDTDTLRNMPNAIISALTYGNYNLTVKNLYCSADTTFELSLNDQMSLIIDSLKHTDCMDTLGLIQLQVTNAAPTYTYRWLDENADSTKKLLIRRELLSGTYSLSVWNDYGCRRDTSINIETIHPLQLFVTADTTICRGEDFVLNAYALAGKPLGNDVKYKWTPDQFLKYKNDTFANPVLRGNYPGIFRNKKVSLFVSANYGKCETTDTVVISYHPYNGISLRNSDTVSRGEYTVRPLIGGSGVYERYMWSPNIYVMYGTDTTRDLTVNLKQPVKYYFTGISEFGCIESDSIVLFPAALTKPTDAFTPNGDGFNDYWHIYNAEFYPDILVEVFSRWGDKVFTQKGYNNDDKVWRGTYKGKDLPIGTYYYVIRMKGETPVTGSITIVR